MKEERKERKRKKGEQAETKEVRRYKDVSMVSWVFSFFLFFFSVQRPKRLQGETKIKSEIERLQPKCSVQLTQPRKAAATMT